jgi:hypothetical protein
VNFDVRLGAVVQRVTRNVRRRLHTELRSTLTRITQQEISPTAHVDAKSFAPLHDVGMRSKTESQGHRLPGHEGFGVRRTGD